MKMMEHVDDSRTDRQHSNKNDYLGELKLWLINLTFNKFIF
jgi:hypothetical protein